MPTASDVVVETPTIPTPIVIVTEPVWSSPVTNGQAPAVRADRSMRADRPLRSSRIGLGVPESARLRAPVNGETGEFPALPRSLRD